MPFAAHKASALLANSRWSSILASTNCTLISSGSRSRKSCSKSIQGGWRPRRASISFMSTEDLESPRGWVWRSHVARSLLLRPKVSNKRSFKAWYSLSHGGALMRSNRWVAVLWSKAVGVVTLTPKNDIFGRHGWGECSSFEVANILDVPASSDVCSGGGPLWESQITVDETSCQNYLHKTTIHENWLRSTHIQRTLIVHKVWWLVWILFTTAAMAIVIVPCLSMIWKA